MSDQTHTGSTYDPDEPTPEQTECIRELNDQLRKFHRGGKLVLTRGVVCRDEHDVHEIICRVAAFDRFDDDNDYWCEHDLGVVQVQDENYIWKIDYYDSAMTYRSPDPSDPNQTIRVLTIMLAAEY